MSALFSFNSILYRESLNQCHKITVLILDTISGTLDELSSG